MDYFDTTTAPENWPTEQLEAWLDRIDPTNCDGLGELKGVIANRLRSLRARLAAAEAERDNLTAKLALGWMDAGHCCCDRPGDDNTDRQVCAYHGRKLDELADAKARAAKLEAELTEARGLIERAMVYTGCECGECWECQANKALRGEEVQGE